MKTENRYKKIEQLLNKNGSLSVKELAEIVDVSEVDGEELTNRLIGYMKKKSIRFESMRPFLPYYPERIYKNMYEVGLLNGVSA